MDACSTICSARIELLSQFAVLFRRAAYAVRLSARRVWERLASAESQVEKTVTTTAVNRLTSPATQNEGGFESLTSLILQACNFFRAGRRATASGALPLLAHRPLTRRTGRASGGYAIRRAASGHLPAHRRRAIHERTCVEAGDSEG